MPVSIISLAPVPAMPIGTQVRTHGHIRVGVRGTEYRKVHIGTVVDSCFASFGGHRLYKLATRYGVSDWVSYTQVQAI